jgi:hypothetical protein
LPPTVSQPASHPGSRGTRGLDFLEPGMAMITKPFTIDTLGEAIGPMIRGE